MSQFKFAKHFLQFCENGLSKGFTLFFWSKSEDRVTLNFDVTKASFVHLHYSA